MGCSLGSGTVTLPRPWESHLRYHVPWEGWRPGPWGMEGWRAGELEGWRIGGLEGWRFGRMVGPEHEGSPCSSLEEGSPTAPPSPLPTLPSQGPSFEEHLSLSLRESESCIGLASALGCPSGSSQPAQPKVTIISLEGPTAAPPLLERMCLWLPLQALMAGPSGAPLSALLQAR